MARLQPHPRAAVRPRRGPCPGPDSVAIQGHASMGSRVSLASFLGFDSRPIMSTKKTPPQGGGVFLVEVVGVPPRHPCGVTLRPREMLARRLTPPAVHWTASGYGYLPAFQRFRLPPFIYTTKGGPIRGPLLWWRWWESNPRPRHAGWRLFHRLGPLLGPSGGERTSRSVGAPPGLGRRQGASRRPIWCLRPAGRSHPFGGLTSPVPRDPGDSLGT